MESTVSVNITDINAALDSTFKLSHLANLFNDLVLMLNEQKDSLKQQSQLLQSQQEQILVQQELSRNQQVQINSQEEKINLHQEHINEINSKLSKLQTTQDEHSEWIAEKVKEDATENMNLFDVSGADPLLAQHRKNIQYQHISEINERIIPISYGDLVERGLNDTNLQGSGFSEKISESRDLSSDKNDSLMEIPQTQLPVSAKQGLDSPPSPPKGIINAQPIILSQKVITSRHQDESNKTLKGDSQSRLSQKDDSLIIQQSLKDDNPIRSILKEEGRPMSRDLSSRPMSRDAPRHSIMIRRKSSLKDKEFTRLAAMTNPEWTGKSDPGAVNANNSRPLSRQKSRKFTVINQNVKPAKKLSNRVWTMISPERRNKILSELAIRGRYIINARNENTNSGKSGKGLKDFTMELFTGSLHKRLLVIEKELVEAYSKLNVHEQLITNMPDLIKALLFPNIDTDKLEENILQASQLYIQFEEAGGIAESVQQMKEYNYNVKVGKEELRVKQEQLSNDLLDLKETVTDVDRKMDRTVLDISTLSAVFGIQTLSSTASNLSPPTLQSVEDARQKFNKATWQSMRQLYTTSPETDANTNSDGERSQVLNGLKDFILRDLVDKEINVMKSDTNNLKNEFKKFDKGQLLQELAVLKKQFNDKFNEVEANHNLIRAELLGEVENSIGSGKQQQRIGSGGGGDGISQEDFTILAQNVQRLTMEQASAIGSMVTQLKRLQNEMNEKPSVDSMEQMIKIIELTFKRQLGENVVGLKVTVGQVIKAVQQKASKEEVLKLVAKRISEMEASGHDMGYDGPDMAGSLKCISCGTDFAHGAPNSRVGSNASRRPFTTSSSALRGLLTRGRSPEDRVTPASTPYSLESSANVDIKRLESALNRAKSIPSEKLLIGIDSLNFSNTHTLKPLLGQQQPDEPIAHPFSKSNSADQRPRRGMAIAQEPAFRKARMASTMKELVKVKREFASNRPHSTAAVFQHRNDQM